MSRIITITDCIRSFSDIIGRVHYKGEVFDIKKGSNIVARLSPAKSRPTLVIKDLNNFFANGPHLEEEDREEFVKCLDELRSLKDIGGFNKWE